MLDFDTLRRTNVQRCEQAFHALHDWSPTDWACAMAGEAGEACNLVKKLRRLDSEKTAWQQAGRDTLVPQIGDEIADLVIYADLLAARLGIDLGAAVVAKFNATSEKVGSLCRLGPPLVFREPIHAEPVAGDAEGGCLVTLSCGHKLATRVRAPRYPCSACARHAADPTPPLADPGRAGAEGGA